ncbi:MAG: LysR family transcriptional regulator [Betaproteobacteria bacterium]|nr:LysR family transcriptional regulator [Betaproteobacteria bacterium]
MKLSLDALQVLDAIDRKGSFAAAANELNRVPSAVTYSIQQLEQDLDVLLFDRSGHRARLTAAGYELLSEGRHLLRAAADLECRIHQVAKGWETELRIAVDTIIGAEKLFPLLDQFYQLESGTRIRIQTEVLAGGWDALLSERADLVIGASGDPPAGGGFASFLLGRLKFSFVAAPSHSVNKEPLPLTEASILKYRAISVADSSRRLPPRTVGLISGQDVLTLPSMSAKTAAHIAGLGVGFLPSNMAEREAAAGRLNILPVENSKAAGDALVAWRSNRTGKALRWFLDQLQQPEIARSLLSDQLESSTGNKNPPPVRSSKEK